MKNTNSKNSKYIEDFLLWQYLEAKISGTYIYNETEFKLNNGNISISVAAIPDYMKNILNLF